MPDTPADGSADRPAADPTTPAAPSPAGPPPNSEPDRDPDLVADEDPEPDGDGDPEPETDAAELDEPAPQPRRAVFRPSSLQVLVALAIAFCATPFALGAPLLWLIYLVPLAIIGWTLRVRTEATAEAVTVRRVLGGRRVPWTEISSLRLRPATRHTGSRVSAVLTDGDELPLPAVTLRDLPQLAAVSGGRLPDPAGE